MSKNYELEAQLLAEFRQGECVVASPGVKSRSLKRVRLPPLGKTPNNQCSQIFDQKIRPILVESRLIRMLNQGDR